MNGGVSLPIRKRAAEVNRELFHWIDADRNRPFFAFINYFLRPEVSASLTNELGYATANKASLAHVKPEIAKDPEVFPDAANLQKMVSPASFSNEARESMSNVYTLFKKGS